MGQVHKLSHDYFEVNTDRDKVFLEMFSQDNPDVHEMSALYDFCSHDEAFTDIADFINSQGRCMRESQSLGNAIVTFMDHMRSSHLFTDEMENSVRNKLRELLLIGYKQVESLRQEILNHIMETLDKQHDEIEKTYIDARRRGIHFH